MTSFRPVEYLPRRFPGLAVGLLGLGAALLLFGAIVRSALVGPLNGATFIHALAGLLVLAVAGNFALLTYGLWSLRYRLTRDSLEICWAHITHRVPLARVREVVPATGRRGDGETGGSPLPLGAGIPAKPVRGEGAPPRPPSSPRLRVSGVNWPGYHIGRGVTADLGRVICYSAHRRAGELTYVRTPGLTYAISPADAAGFAAEVARRRAEVGLDTAARPVTFDEWRFIRSPFWRDRWAQAVILLAMAVNLALFGYLLIAFPRLPPLIPLHWNIDGVVDRIGFAPEIFTLPTIALAVLGLNFVLGVLIHRRETLAAYILFGSALWVQVLFLFASVRIAQ